MNFGIKCIVTNRENEHKFGSAFARAVEMEGTLAKLLKWRGTKCDQVFVAKILCKFFLIGWKIYGLFESLEQSSQQQDVSGLLQLKIVKFLYSNKIT